MPFILQAPEEQTDNWDDDFEEGISLTKIHGTTGWLVYLEHVLTACVSNVSVGEDLGRS